MRQRRWSLGISHGLANVDSFHSSYGKNVTGPPKDFIHPLQSFKGVQLCDLGLLNTAVELCDSNLVSDPKRTVENAGNGQASEIVAVIEVCYEDLQCASRIAGRIGY